MDASLKAGDVMICIWAETKTSHFLYIYIMYLYVEPV